MKLTKKDIAGLKHEITVLAKLWEATGIPNDEVAPVYVCDGDASTDNATFCFDNESGDKIFAIFTNGDCIIKGFYHELAGGTGGSGLAKRDGIPQHLLNEVDKWAAGMGLQDATFYVWRERKGNEWKSNFGVHQNGGVNDFCNGCLFASAKELKKHFVEEMLLESLPLADFEKAWTTGEITEKLKKALQPTPKAGTPMHELYQKLLAIDTAKGKLRFDGSWIKINFHDSCKITIFEEQGRWTAFVKVTDEGATPVFTLRGQSMDFIVELVRGDHLVVQSKKSGILNWIVGDNVENKYKLIRRIDFDKTKWASKRNVKVIAPEGVLVDSIKKRL